MSTKTSGRLQLMNKSTTAKTTKSNFQTTIQKPRNFNPSKFSTLTVCRYQIKQARTAGTVEPRL